MPSNLEQKISQAQKRRMQFLEADPNSFSGNRRERLQYLQFLDEMGVELTDFQFDACIGLCLSDASLQSGSASPREPEKTLTRLKMTQATKHESFLYHVKDVLRIYTGNEKPFAPLSTRSQIYEFTTLRCQQLTPLASVFSDEPPRTDGVIPKKITNKLKPYITPVSVAYWFCGDGGKADFTSNKGKGITFHTQCFSKQECELLASFISDNLGLDAEAKLDVRSSNQYRVDILGPSYDKFIEIVGPFIHPSMAFKLPEPRVKGSRFGFADTTFYKNNTSIFFNNENYLTKYTRNM